MLLTMLTGWAFAAPVLWLGAPDPAQERQIFQLPGVDGRVQPIELLALPTDEPEAALVALEQTLADVAAFETRLDGELVIMADLEAALDRVTLVPDDAARALVFRAQAYQGFAVERFFAGGLATDDEAQPWRRDVGGRVVVRPWRDAVALDPNREATEAEIREAPQRVAFNDARQHLLGVLPCGVRAGTLPEGAVLWLDGRSVASDGSTTRVPPGRHHLHVMLDGAVLDHRVVELGVAESITVDLPAAREALDTFLDGLAEGSEVPDLLQGGLERLGGRLVVGRSGAEGPQIWSVTARGVESVVLEPTEPAPGPAPTTGLSLVVRAAGGWLSSADFYIQAYDVAPNTRATVNSTTGELGVRVRWDRGVFRAGAGLDVLYTPGAHHRALVATTGWRARPVPHVLVGTRYAGITAGFLLPHHPVVGLRGTVPLGPLELGLDGRLGVGGTLTRDDGTTYDAAPVYALSFGVGFVP